MKRRLNSDKCYPNNLINFCKTMAKPPSYMRESSLSPSSLSTMGSDVDEELIIERAPLVYKHDDPPQTYKKIEALVLHLKNDMNNVLLDSHFTDLTNSKPIADLHSVVPSLIHINLDWSIEEYNSFNDEALKFCRSSTPIEKQLANSENCDAGKREDKEVSSGNIYISNSKPNHKRISISDDVLNEISVPSKRARLLETHSVNRDSFTSRDSHCNISLNKEINKADVGRKVDVRMDTDNVNNADIGVEMDAVNVNNADVEVQLDADNVYNADVGVKMVSDNVNNADVEGQMDADNVNIDKADVGVQVDIENIYKRNVEVQVNVENEKIIKADVGVQVNLDNICIDKRYIEIKEDVKNNKEGVALKVDADSVKINKADVGVQVDFINAKNNKAAVKLQIGVDNVLTFNYNPTSALLILINKADVGLKVDVDNVNIYKSDVGLKVDIDNININKADVRLKADVGTQVDVDNVKIKKVDAGVQVPLLVTWNYFKNNYLCEVKRVELRN